MKKPHHKRGCNKYATVSNRGILLNMCLNLFYKVSFGLGAY